MALCPFYFERQQDEQCGEHALNALCWGQVFVVEDLRYLCHLMIHQPYE